MGQIYNKLSREIFLDERQIRARIESESESVVAIFDCINARDGMTRRATQTCEEWKAGPSHT
jgi:hypothetical protein